MAAVAVAAPFLDTNLFLRHLTEDHPTHSPRATALLRRIAAGDTAAWTADTAVFETVFTLQRFYGRSRTEIQQVMLPLLALPGIKLRGKGRYRRVFDLYVQLPSLSFADCYHVALIESRGLAEIVSFDRKPRQVVTLVRLEPDTTGALVVAAPTDGNPT